MGARPPATSLPDGGDPTIWEHYGDIANAQGLKNEARTGWERALDWTTRILKPYARS